MNSSVEFYKYYYNYLCYYYYYNNLCYYYYYNYLCYYYFYNYLCYNFYYNNLCYYYYYNYLYHYYYYNYLCYYYYYNYLCYYYYCNLGRGSLIVTIYTITISISILDICQFEIVLLCNLWAFKKVWNCFLDFCLLQEMKYQICVKECFCKGQKYLWITNGNNLAIKHLFLNFYILGKCQSKEPS